MRKARLLHEIGDPDPLESPLPEHPGRGLAFLEQVAPLGLPVIAIGGITAARAKEVRDAGAYGVAAIAALWRTGDPAAAALALLAPWMADE